MKLYKSKDNIWWNKGNEVKPQLDDFLNIEWEELPNFNISWVNEYTITFTCGINDTFDLVKIVNENTEDPYDKVRYYYLIGINNKTKVNKEVVFELDLWTTYILEQKNRFFEMEYWTNIIQTKGELIERVKKLGFDNSVQLIPAGVPSARKSIDTYTEERTIEINNTMNAADIKNAYGNEGEVTTWMELSNVNINVNYPTDKSKNYANVSRIPNQTLNQLYYMFKGSGGNYVIVPIFNEGKYEDTSINNSVWWTGRVDRAPGVESASNGYVVNNSKKYLDFMVEHYGKYSVKYQIRNITEGKDENFRVILGELVGVYIGPSVDCIVDKPKVIRRDNNNNVVTNITMKLTFENSNIEFTTFTSIGQGDNNNLMTLCYIINEQGLNVDFKKHKIENINAYLDGMTILNNPNINVILNSKKLYFTNMFVLTDGNESIELPTEVPYYIDSYNVKMNNQMNTYNTSYALGNFNAVKNGIMGVVGSIGRGYSPATSSTIYNATRGVDTNNVLDARIDLIKYGPRGGLNKIGFKNYYSQLQTPYMKESFKTINNAASFNPISAGIGAASSVVNTGIQLASNYLTRQSQLEDMRNTLSTISTTTSAASLALQQWQHEVFIKFNSQTKTSFNMTIKTGWILWYGYKLEGGDYFYKLYGYQKQYESEKVSIYDKLNTKCTLRLPSIKKLNYLAQSTNILSPTIRDMLWQLLENGVIIISKDELNEIGGAY